MSFKAFSFVDDITKFHSNVKNDAKSNSENLLKIFEGKIQSRKVPIQVLVSLKFKSKTFETWFAYKTFKFDIQ